MYNMTVNFMPLCISISTLFLGGVPTWLIYIFTSFGGQLLVYYYRKNQNYYKTEFIDGKEYPFVDYSEEPLEMDDVKANIEM